MELARSRLDDHRDRAARVDSVIGGVVAGQNLKFSQRIRTDGHVQPAAAAAVIDFAAVDQPVVVVPPAAVEVDLSAGALRGNAIELGQLIRNTGAKRRERHHAAPVGGKLQAPDRR